MDSLENEQSTDTDYKKLSNEISEILITLGKIIEKADLIFVWRNYYNEEKSSSLLYKEQIFEWNRKNKTKDCSIITNKLEEVIVPPELEEALIKDLPVFTLVSEMTDVYSQSLLEENNVKAVLMVSIFVAGKLYGCLSLDNCSTDENFNNDEINIVKKFGDKLGKLLEK